jgi:hypothetical protein
MLAHHFVSARTRGCRDPGERVPSRNLGDGLDQFAELPHLSEADDRWDGE